MLKKDASQKPQIGQQNAKHEQICKTLKKGATREKRAQNGKQGAKLKKKGAKRKNKKQAQNGKASTN